MARSARTIAVGHPHHITQRGNFGQEVFDTEEAREVYLDWLGECGSRHGVRVWAYCLMTNHVHLVAVPAREDSLGRCLREVHGRYSQRLNRRRQRRGHLWQGRFYSCPLDERHSWAAVRYVERNPVRAKLVERAEDYWWSSAAAHCGLRSEALLAPEFPPAGIVKDWSAWLGGEENEEAVRVLRRKTHAGDPCGDEEFIAALERLLGGSLARRPVGRPRKAQPGSEA